MPVPFLTSVKYGVEATTWRQTITEFVDDYFQLFSGRVAVFIPSCKVKHELFRAEEGKAQWWCLLIKAMSYGAWFFSRLIEAHSPGIFALRGVAQLRMVVDYFPLFMLMAKIALRSRSAFCFYTQPDPSKRVLDSLLGRKSPLRENKLSVDQCRMFKRAGSHSTKNPPN